MKKGWKIILTIICTILVLLAIIIFTLIYTKKIEIGFDNNGKFQILINNEVEGMDSYDQIIAAAKTTYPTDVFVYGRDCDFRKTAEYIPITELSKESLKSDKKYKVIVINDMEGNLTLTDSDFKLLYDYVINSDYAMMYIGTKYNEEFINREFIVNDFAEGALAFGVRTSNGIKIQSSGLWDEQTYYYYQNEDKELLGECIFRFVKKVIDEV